MVIWLRDHLKNEPHCRALVPAMHCCQVAGIRLAHDLVHSILLIAPLSPCNAAAVAFQLSGGQCLHTVGFDSTSFWVLQVQPCSSDVLAQRFIVKDSIQQTMGSKVESLVATTKCLSYSLGETACRHRHSQVGVPVCQLYICNLHGALCSCADERAASMLRHTTPVSRSLTAGNSSWPIALLLQWLP